MKKILSLMAMSAFILTVNVVFAGSPGNMQTTLQKNDYNPWYARVGTRAAWMSADTIKDDQKSAGFGGVIGFGREFGKFRTELELAHQRTDSNPFNTQGTRYDDRVELTTVLANGYYECPVYEAFSVYGMVGLGYAEYDLTQQRNGVNRGDYSSTSSIAYKAGAGVSYAFAKNIAADLGYEYLGIADHDAAKDVKGQNFIASFRYKF
jgi:opacity protein-like surface antigen